MVNAVNVVRLICDAFYSNCFHVAAYFFAKQKGCYMVAPYQYLEHPFQMYDSTVDPHFSSGTLELDPQISFEARNSDAQFSHVVVPSEYNKYWRRKSSIVWKYFTVEVETVGANLPRAICNICKQSFVFISSSNNNAGTSHLKRHLDRHIDDKSFQVGSKKLPTTKFAGVGVKNKGGQNLVDKPKIEVETNGSSSIYFQQKSLSIDQEGYCNGIVKMIIQHDYPLDIVENPRFINFTGALQPQYKIKSATIIEEQITRLYLTEKQNISRILAGIPGRVSLALDLRSSDQSFGHVILTGQFLNSDWKLQRRILNVIRLTFPDSEAAFSHAVSSCLSDWGLETKLFSLTLNDNIVKGNLRGLLSINNPKILNGQLITGSCYARVLSGVAREALTSMDALIEKVRKNVKYVVTSESRGVKFDEIRHKLQVRSIRDLEIDDKTKWNTTYEMLVAASELKEVYFEFYNLFPDYEETVTVKEWRKVEILTMYMKLLYDSISVLHDGAIPKTADLFFHEAWKIQVELMNGASSQDLFVSNLTKRLKGIFDTYWKDCSLTLAVAVVMDPRFKMKFIELCFSEMYGDDAETWITVIDEGLHELFLEYFRESLPPPPPPPPLPFTNKIGTSVEMDREDDSLLYTCNDDFLDFDFYIARIMGGPLSKSELDEYLEESLLDHVQDFDVLDWWREKRSKYPTLSRVASDILCIPVSTLLDRDSAFDMSERKMDRQRSKLRPSTLEALICTKDWLQLA